MSPTVFKTSQIESGGLGASLRPIKRVLNHHAALETREDGRGGEDMSKRQTARTASARFVSEPLIDTFDHTTAPGPYTPTQSDIPNVVRHACGISRVTVRPVKEDLWPVSPPAPDRLHFLFAAFSGLWRHRDDSS